MYQGQYHGKTKHHVDLAAVVARAKDVGVEKMLITGTSLSESRAALKLAKQFDIHCTAGVHPTSTSELDTHASGSEGYLQELSALIQEDRGESGSKRIISVGEIGLDYDRLHHSPRETQLRYLPALLRLSKTFALPLFLHSRHPEAHVDLIRILKEVGWGDKGEGWHGGVVHSFTGSMAEMTELVEMGLHIGINGCGLKTEGNLSVVKEIPLDKLLLETDAPWCTPSSTHASFPLLPEIPVVNKVSKPQSWKEGMGVKSRFEPAEVVTIAHVVAKVKGISVEELAERAWENSIRLFWPEEATR
ncbi:TatD DNase family protein, partial [Tremellales sp. Uapishka_1]